MELLGVIAAIFVVIFLVAISAALIFAGHDWAGVVIIGSNLFGLAALFLYGPIRRISQQPRVPGGGSTHE